MSGREGSPSPRRGRDGSAGRRRPRETTASSPLVVRIQSDASASTSSPSRSPSWSSTAMSGGSSSSRPLRDDLAKQHIARSRERKSARLRDRCAAPRTSASSSSSAAPSSTIAVAGVPDRREAVADLVVGVARVNASRVREHGLENRPDLLGATLEKVGVKALEPLFGPAIRGAIRRQRAGEGCRPSGTDLRACLGHARATASSSWVPARMQLSCAMTLSPAPATQPRPYGAAPASRSESRRSTSCKSSSVSFQRSKTRIPDGLFPPVSAAMTTGISGLRARAALAVRNASATVSAPSRTAMSTSGREWLPAAARVTSAPRPRSRGLRAGSGRAAGSGDRGSRRAREHAARRPRRRTLPALGRLARRQRCVMPRRRGRRPRARACGTRRRTSRRPRAHRGTTPFATARPRARS